MELTAFTPCVYTVRLDAQFLELVTSQLPVIPVIPIIPIIPIDLTLAPCLWKGNSSGRSRSVTRNIRRTVGLSSEVTECQGL